MSNSKTADKKANIDSLLKTITRQPVAEEPVAVVKPVPTPKPKREKMVIQEAKPQGVLGRARSDALADVPDEEATKVSPRIPKTLKRKIDIALADPLANDYKTFNDFAAAAFRALLKAHDQPSDQ